MSMLDQVSGLGYITGTKIQIYSRSVKFSPMQVQELDIADFLIIRDMSTLYLYRLRRNVHHDSCFRDVSVTNEAPLRIQVPGHFKPLDICHRNIFKPQILSYIIQRIIVSAMAVQKQKMCKSIGNQLVTDFLYICRKCCL